MLACSVFIYLAIALKQSDDKMVVCRSLRSIKDKITRRLSLSVENVKTSRPVPQMFSTRGMNACQLEVAEGRRREGGGRGKMKEWKKRKWSENGMLGSLNSTGFHLPQAGSCTSCNHLHLK